MYTYAQAYPKRPWALTCCVSSFAGLPGQQRTVHGTLPGPLCWSWWQLPNRWCRPNAMIRGGVWMNLVSKNKQCLKPSIDSIDWFICICFQYIYIIQIHDIHIHIYVHAILLLNCIWPCINAMVFWTSASKMWHLWASRFLILCVWTPLQTTYIHNTYRYIISI